MPDPARSLTDLMNVGPKVAAYFSSIGVTSVPDLAGADAVELFERMCAKAGEPLDPCLLDTVMSAVDQADGKPARAWWNYSEERTRLRS